MEDAKSFIQEEDAKSMIQEDDAPDVSEEEQMVKCENCDYKTSSNNELTRHKDEKHIQDIWLVGTKRDSEMVKSDSIEEPEKKKRHEENKDPVSVVKERTDNMDRKVL